MTNLNQRIALCADMIVRAQHLVVFTGAGISTESGLPDYRGPDGVWTRRDLGLPPPQMRKPMAQVEPNAGHRALVTLQNIGKLVFLISQNVDNLHLKSGIKPGMIAELHGNYHLMKCLRCDKRYSKTAVGWDDQQWGNGYRTSPYVPGQPKCTCGGRIISSVVNFGDPMPEKEMVLSMNYSKKADLFIVIGSSLQVSPANDFPRYAIQYGGKLIILNNGATPLDSLACLRFTEDISPVLDAIIKQVVSTLPR